MSSMSSVSGVQRLIIVHRICALTIYRICDTTTISAANAQAACAVIAMLTSLEALLGVINACLPVLKPIFNKMRGTAPAKSSNAVNEILKSGTIPIFMRVSQMWTSSSRKGKYSSNDEETLTENSIWNEERKYGKASTRGGMDASVTTKEISVPKTPKSERILGIKVPEIYVRREVEVESVRNGDERGPVNERREGRQDLW